MSELLVSLIYVACISDLTLHEMRSTLDQARETLLLKQEKALKEKMDKAVEETKKKQWVIDYSIILLTTIIFFMSKLLHKWYSAQPRGIICRV